jgi:hypothetical protein
MPKIASRATTIRARTPEYTKTVMLELRASTQPEERQDGEDDHHQADEIDDRVHAALRLQCRGQGNAARGAGFLRKP